MKKSAPTPRSALRVPISGSPLTSFQQPFNKNPKHMYYQCYWTVHSHPTYCTTTQQKNNQGNSEQSMEGVGGRVYCTLMHVFCI